VVSSMFCLFSAVSVPSSTSGKDVWDHSTIFATVHDISHVALTGGGTATTSPSELAKRDIVTNMIDNPGFFIRFSLYQIKVVKSRILI